MITMAASSDELHGGCERILPNTLVSLVPTASSFETLEWEA